MRRRGCFIFPDPDDGDFLFIDKLIDSRHIYLNDLVQSQELHIRLGAESGKYFPDLFAGRSIPACGDTVYTR